MDTLVGFDVGMDVGLEHGTLVFADVAIVEGAAVGFAVLGDLVGNDDGDEVGDVVTFKVGDVGILLGLSDGQGQHGEHDVHG